MRIIVACSGMRHVESSREMGCYCDTSINANHIWCLLYLLVEMIKK